MSFKVPQWPYGDLGVHESANLLILQCVVISTVTWPWAQRNPFEVALSYQVLFYISCLSLKQDRKEFKTTSRVVTILSMKLFYPYRIITLHIFIAIISRVAGTTRCLLSTSRCPREEEWAVTIATSFINRVMTHARPRLQLHVLWRLLRGAWTPPSSPPPDTSLLLATPRS